MNELGQVPDVLVSEFSDDEDLMELIEMFVEELPKRAESVSKALAEEDFTTLQTLAHQLKGAAGGYGFSSISDVAQALEETCKAEKDLEKLAAQAQQVAAYCRAARAK